MAVCCAGTSDVPACEEAVVTLSVMGVPAIRIYDVGVAGLHRLLARRGDLERAVAVIVAAGMEGALPSVVGGLVGKPVIGLPGHPASAYVVLHALAGPLLAAMSGTPWCERKVLAVLAENIPSQKGRAEFVRVRIEDGRAVPCFGKSGLLNTFAASDGMVRVPAGREGFEAGETVEVILW